MQVGDLVQLAYMAIRELGIVISIERAKSNRYEDTFLVLWTDGETTSEFRDCLEVVCK